MPNRHVYGKRSRAIYDPLAAFASPQRSPPDPANERSKSMTTKAKESRKADQTDKPTGKDSKSRKALGEINANEAVKPVNPLKVATQNKPAHRRKVVVDESKDKRIDTDADEDKVANDLIAGEALESQSMAHGDVTGDTEGIPQRDGHREVQEYQNQQIRDCTIVGPEIDVATKDDDSKGKPETPQLVAATPSIDISPPTPPTFDEYSEHCSGLLELSSHRMTDFTEWANDLSSHFNIKKIAEASFGEVYRLSLLERISGFSRNDESVIKVIPLKPPDCKLPTDKRKLNAILKRNEGMTKPEDVATEVRLLQRMSDVPGFTNFREVRVIKGRPPQAFAKAFKDFNAVQKAKKKELSVFPDPAKKTSYPDDQLWAVIEMQDAGTDLEIMVEGGDCSSMWSVWDIFWQVALSLAKGEEEAEFEHRDLHLGNICVRRPKNWNEQSTMVHRKRKLHFTGLETTIIDYTISRATMLDSSIAHKDLELDTTIFEGDSTDEYQYEIYRYMRSALFLDNALAKFPARLPPAARDRSWQQYHPITNLVWLHFILYKLLEQVNWPSATKAPPKKDHEAHATWKRANDLEHVLSRVADILDPSNLFESEIGSSSALVLHAICEGWLDQSDVVREGKWDDEDVEQALVAQFHDLGLEANAVDALEEKSEGADDLRSRSALRKGKR